MINEISQAATFAPSPGLADQIADHVQKQIVSGELRPGERIAEAHITRELGVSRGPVRESMRLLSRRHLVELLPRKGARVSDFGVDDVNSLYDLPAGRGVGRRVRRAVDLAEPRLRISFLELGLVLLHVFR